MIPSRPSRTAEAVCFMRATDQARPPEERILDDVYASWFLGGFSRTRLGTGRLAGAILPNLTTFVLTRHRYMDERLLAALGAPRKSGAVGVVGTADVRPPPVVAEQVLILGAGYDMRAHRFADAIGGRPVFEVDYPSTADRKARLLAGKPLPPVDKRAVAIDFQKDALADVLVAAGLRPGAPTFVVWEGVSMYLTRAAVKATLTTLRGLLGPGSRLTADFWQYLDAPDLAATAHRVSAGLLHILGEPVTFALHPEEAPGFFARLGWSTVDVADAAELERRYVPDGRRVYAANYVVTVELPLEGTA
jgi:methyltransferase (TIGR00027 family)